MEEAIQPAKVRRDEHVRPSAAARSTVSGGFRGKLGNPPVTAIVAGAILKISPSEQRVLWLVGRAQTNKEIAAHLGLSPATVKRHIEKILAKLGLRNRVEAAIYALLAQGCPNDGNRSCPLRDALAPVSE